MMIQIVLMHKVTNSKWKKTWNRVCARFRVKTVFLLLCAGLYSCTERTEFDVSQTGIFSKFVPQPVLLSLFSPGDSCRITTDVTAHSFTLNNSVNNVIPDSGYLESLETGERHELKIDKEGKGLYYSPVNFTEGGVYSVFLRFSSIKAEPVEATDTIPFASTIEKLTLTPKAKNVNDNLLTRVRLEVLPADLSPFSFYEISVQTEVTDSVSSDGFYIDENLRMPSFAYLSSDDPLISDKMLFDISGAADIDLALDVSSLQTKVSGAANIKFNGRAKKHNVRLSGASNIRAEELRSDNTDISLSGAGSAHIYASEKLEAALSGVGSIRYYGEPNNIKINKSGIGSIRAVNQ